MNSKFLNEKPYSKLVRTLFLQTIALLGVAWLLVTLLRVVFKGNMADTIVEYICYFRDVTWEEGVQIYMMSVRNNLYLIIAAVVCVVFFILFRIALSKFTGYFDQIVSGIDSLAEENNRDIRMDSKLKYVEDKLNETKDKLRERKEAVQLAEERKNELILYLAHDIKTPLTSVIGYLNLLDENPDMPVEQRARNTNIALEKAYRLEMLINEFFEIARYNSGTVPLSKKQIDIGYMMIQVAEELYPQTSKNSNDVKIEIPDEMKVTGDPQKLARVFNNIIKNAAAYGEAGKPITVSASETKEMSIIRIENKGEIPADKLDSLFDKFYRLDEARTTTTGGSGLGLAIAKDIVNLHGGRINAGSGGGVTTFTVELPKAM